MKTKLSYLGFFVAGAALIGSSAGAVTITYGPFSNPAAITIPAGAPTTTSGIAAPYPSNITVTGAGGLTAKVTVSLFGLGHTFPDDIDILLVSPTGQKVLLMSDAGGGTDVTGLTLTFDDLAPSGLPDSAVLSSGTFKPTNFGLSDTFPSPAPVGPFGSTLSAFNGASPNGTWSLYVVDAFGADVGTISGGWSLTITTTPQPPIITIDTPPDNAIYLLGQNVLADYNCVPVDGATVTLCAGNVADGAAIDTGSVGTKTFTVNSQDNSGDTSVLTHTYRVVWNFSRFFQSAKAGSVVPLSFSLGGDQGLDIFKPGSPSSIMVNCVTGEPSGPQPKVLSPGSTSLKYQAGQRTYRLNWKTERDWEGTCRKLILDLKDDQTYEERYDFR